MVHSHNEVSGRWKICQDLWDLTWENEQGYSNRTAGLWAALIPSHAEARSP